jgi:tripartite-type tricarboxylate transporter receptor subunit TctC
MNRTRTTTAAFAGAFAAALHVNALAADDYPIRPIRVVVPYAAGGADLYVRPIQQRIEQMLGQPLIIDNVGGAGGIVGATQVRNAPADGHTVLFAGIGAVVTAPKIADATYTWRDFTPVANIVAIPFTLVTHPGTGIKNLAGLIARAKAEPGKITYGSPGHGTSTQVAVDAMANEARIKLNEVPYQGGVPAMNAALGGHVDTMIGTPSIVMPQVRAGKLIALAVTGPERFAPSPEVPTLRESGVNVVVVANYGVFVRRGTPDAVVRKLAAAFAGGASDPAYVQLMRKGYNDVAYLGPAEYAVAVEEEDRHFTRLMRDAGMQIK